MMKKTTPQIQGANILLTYGDTLLLQLRDDKPSISYPNHWALPGSKREGKETAAENAIRELQEESGYQMTNP
jgi:8-oxo-dGTP diphosphatase